jgi:hypothetical protein
MEMLMTATVTSGQTFEQWNEDDNAKDRGLGFSEVDQGWDSWIGTESPRPSTEGVALTFREAVTENPVEVDLGTGGLSLHLLGRGGDTPTINGSDVTGLTTNDFNTVIASATGLETITAFANASNDKTDFALDTLDINNATVIPEPSTFALLTGVLGLGLVILRRRPRS